jgi:rSAM/selenodomain-associated transferase 1
MFRIPEFGNVKKRLAVQIGDSEALKLYAYMLHVTITKILHLKKIDFFGFYESLHPQNIKIDKITTIPQQGKDLGEKMFNAINYLFKKDYTKVVLIGADSPDLPLNFIERAFFELNIYDLVLGPTEDGGYYLIGMKKPYDLLFKDINWGSKDVLKNTLAIADKNGISYFLLEKWYDIDDIEGLKRWKDRLKKDRLN